LKLTTRTYCDGDNPSKAIIALHGWTGDEFVFEPVAKMLNIKDAKWFFPRAPYKAEIKDGNSWFGGNDEEGWQYSKTMQGIDTLVTEIFENGFNNENIYMIGFSQGACLAIEYATRMSFSIGGIIPIAGFIKFKDQLAKEVNAASLKTKVLLLHGENDKTVSINESHKSFTLLKNLGYDVKLNSYEAGHKIPIGSQDYIKEFIM
tara:strand:+ start:1334 stop:1945 length:612 start_codon:yes stop_codon:yes gene_type:complete